MTTIFKPNCLDRMSPGFIASRDITWRAPDGSLLASIALLASGQWIAILPAPGAPFDCYGDGGSAREAYRAAHRKLRLSQHNVADLLRTRKLLSRQSDRWFGSWMLADTRAGNLERLMQSARRRHRRAQVIAGLRALRAQLAERPLPPFDPDLERTFPATTVPRVPVPSQELTASDDADLLGRFEALQRKHTALVALHSVLKGQHDDLCRQHGLPTSADLVVRGPNSRVYPLASQSEPPGDQQEHLADQQAALASEAGGTVKGQPK